MEHLKFGQSDKINISFSNLTYRVPETSHCAHRGFKTILKNVSGEFRSGQERRHYSKSNFGLLCSFSGSQIMFLLNSRSKDYIRLITGIIPNLDFYSTRVVALRRNKPDETDLKKFIFALIYF